MFGKRNVFFRLRRIAPAHELDVYDYRDFETEAEARAHINEHEISDKEYELVRFEKKPPMVRFDLFEYGGKISGAVVTDPERPDQVNVIGGMILSPGEKW